MKHPAREKKVKIKYIHPEQQVQHSHLCSILRETKKEDKNSDSF